MPCVPPACCLSLLPPFHPSLPLFHPLPLSLSLLSVFHLSLSLSSSVPLICLSSGREEKYVWPMAGTTKAGNTGMFGVSLAWPPLPGTSNTLTLPTHKARTEAQIIIVIIIIIIIIIRDTNRMTENCQINNTAFFRASPR